ncbi:MAG: nicotinate-nucleotide adenylyltransferase [Mycoplasmataceae bacterium]|nr:nicotinate-nucleotide adenylyltransferase [Mycoplasmataceae bacterium]MDD7686078.1 nicotinate-nucleotide adenylyltransferase [Mycoplasmataceae bacterium]
MSKIKKILIFGGSFDPVHKGHIDSCNSAIAKVDPDLTIIIPNKIPPLKSTLHASASARDRLNMCKLAFSNMGNLKISSFELRQASNAPSYTYKTIQYLLKKYPEAKLYLLVGYDRYCDFNKWKNYKYILNHVTLVVGIRNTNTLDLKDDKKSIPVLFPSVNISSAELRLKPNKEYMTEPVINYINENGLYAENHIRNLMSEYRFNHTLRVAKTAMQIARAVAPKKVKKAYIAGMYHDVAKEFNETTILSMVKNYDKKLYPTVHTLHGICSAMYIKDNFYINDEEILDAIRNHVIPPMECSTLSMILYCADKLEPGRTVNDVKNRRKKLSIVKKDLKKGFKLLYNEIKERYK